MLDERDDAVRAARRPIARRNTEDAVMMMMYLDVF